MARLEDPGHQAPTVVRDGFTYEEWRPEHPHVAAVWRGRVGAAAHRQRLLPDGCVEIVGDLVFGPSASWSDLELEAHAEHVGLRLRPGHARAMLGVDADELAGLVVERRELGAAGRARPDAAVLAAISLLHARPGVRVRDVANEVGVSERHLRRRFTREVGLGPGTYRRLARVHATMRAAGTQPWAALAYAHGYADQAHLCREVLDLTGSTPTGWL